MSLSINQVVNVQVQQSPQGAKKKDLSVAAIFTKEMCEDFYDENCRYVVVTSANDVANLFGTNSDVHKAASALFSAQPKPKTALIGKFMQDGLSTEARESKIIGATVSDSYINFKLISDGRFSFTLNGEVKNVTGLSFKNVSNHTEIADIINKKLKTLEVTIVYDEVGERYILKSNTTGDSISLGYVFDDEADGTFIGKMLNLVDGRGSLVKGQPAKTYAKETPAEALTKLQNVYQNWYGIYFANVLTDAELTEAHDWVASADMKIMAFTETRTAGIEYSDANVLKKLAKKNSGRLMVQYNNKGNEHAGAELLGLSLTTVWNSASTAKTIKFKQQKSVESDDRITINEAEKCRRLGINYYTDYSGVNMLAEGVMLGGTFIDETLGLDAFADAVQVQVFNCLQGQPTKIPQTDRGQEILLSSAKVIGEQFKSNGFLGNGIWSKSDIGELKNGDKIEGYYFYSESFDVQDTSDRESRKMMPIMCALKLAGAGHSVDVIVQFNR